MKENGLYINADSFAKVCQRNLAHGSYLFVNLGHGHGAFVRLDEKAGQRHCLHSLCLKFRSEGEVETVAQQLFGQLRLPPKSMNNPRDTGFQLFFQTQQGISGFYQMYNQWFACRIGHFCLADEDRFLQSHRSIRQFVQSCLANSQYLWMSYRRLKPFPNLLWDVTSQRPRMYPHRIPLPRTRRKRIRRTVDDAEAIRLHASVRVDVGIIVHKHKGEKGEKVSQGTGSYPEPPHGWQRNRRRTARYNPLKGPCLRMASTAYCEQVGVKRHDGGRKGGDALLIEKDGKQQDRRQDFQQPPHSFAPPAFSQTFDAANVSPMRCKAVRIRPAMTSEPATRSDR